MAETSSTRSPSRTRTASPPKARTARARKAPARASGAHAKPSTARRARSTAAGQTREAVQANTAAAKVTAAQTRGLAERTALMGVGATLEARDRALGLASELVTRYGSLSAAERELARTRKGLGRDFKRYERRGTAARTRVEGDVKQARARLEAVGNRIVEQARGQLAVLP